MTSIKSSTLWALAFVLLMPASWQSHCTGLLPPRLAVGEAARVIPGGVPNRLRDQPSTRGAQVGMAQPETTLTVIGWPVCDAASGIVWWQVQFGNVTGWTAEGLLPDEYFLEPVSEAGIAFGASSGVFLFDLGRGTGRTFEITGGSTGGRIGFNPDGRLMAVVGIEVEGDFDSPAPRFNLFDVETGELLLDTAEYVGVFAFSPDGTLLVVSDGGATRILGIET